MFWIRPPLTTKNMIVTWSEHSKLMEALPFRQCFVSLTPASCPLVAGDRNQQTTGLKTVDDQMNYVMN